MSDRRSFLKAVGAMAMAPAMPASAAVSVGKKSEWHPKLLYIKDGNAWKVNFVRELMMSFQASFLSGERLTNPLHVHFMDIASQRHLILLRSPELSINKIIQSKPYDLISLNYTEASTVPVTVGIHRPDGCQDHDGPHCCPDGHLGIFIHDHFLKIGVKLFKKNLPKDMDISFQCQLALYEFDPVYLDNTKNKHTSTSL